MRIDEGETDAKGAGLGGSIMKRLVEKMKWNIKWKRDVCNCAGVLL